MALQTNISVELNALSKRIQSLTLKRSGLVLGLWGQAGIGKTFAAQQMLQHSTIRHCSIHSTAALTSWLRGLPNPAKLPMWAEVLYGRAVKGEPLEPAQTLDLLGALLGSIAPVVLHLEDTHEASPERLDLIQGLAQVIKRNKGVGLLITSRLQPPEAFEAVLLEALNLEATQQLLQSELKAPIPAEASGWIFERAAGNPLFTLEFLRFLTRRGFLWNDGQQWRWRSPEREVVPVSVEALIEQMLANATPTQTLANALNARAMLPSDVSKEIWVEVAGLSSEQLEQAQAELRGRGILNPDGWLAHPLFREVVLQSLQQEQLRDYSRKAVQVFSQNPVLAARYAEDALLPKEQALALLKQAAEAAESDTQAGRFWLQALKYVGQEERDTFTLEVAQQIQDSHTETALNLLQQNLRANPGHIETTYTLARLLAREFRRKDAEEAFAQLPLSEQNSPRGHVVRIEMSSYLQDNAETVRLWNQHFSHSPNPSPKAAGAAINAMRLLLDLGAAARLCLQTIEQPDLDPWERIRLTNNLGTIYLDQDQYALAGQTFSQAIDLMEQHGLAQRKFVLLYNRALAQKWVGRFAQATADAEESSRLAAEAGQPHNQAQALSLLGEFALEQGRYSEAEDFLQQSAALFTQTSTSNHTVDVHNNLVALYHDWGLPHSGLLALKHGYKALGLAHTADSPSWVLDALVTTAMAEIAFGSLPKALELLDQAEPLAQQLNTPYQIYVLAWAKARATHKLGYTDQAVEYFQTALAGAEQLQHVLDAHKIGLEMAYINHDLEAAQQHLEWFEQNGLHNGANIARRHFPKLNQASQPTHLPRLSQHRLEVLGILSIDGTPVRGRKRQELLALLLEARIAGRSEAKKLDILDLLYPNQDETQASNTLREIIHQLRSNWGEASIITTQGGYALGNLGSDAEVFLQSSDTRLWRGAYLEGLDLPQETVREVLYQALLDKAQGLLESDPKEAVRVGRILLEADPYNPKHLKLSFAALRAVGNHKTLGRLYGQAKERMLEVGEQLPTTWQAFLDN